LLNIGFILENEIKNFQIKNFRISTVEEQVYKVQPPVLNFFLLGVFVIAMQWLG
jgi:hypothetical protein